MKQKWQWFLVTLSLAGNVLVIYKFKEGFLLWTVTNIGWIVVNYKAKIYPEAFMFFVYLILSVQGWLVWNK